jgi:hypothetical protein
VVASVDGDPTGGDGFLRLGRDFATIQCRVFAVEGIGLHRIDTSRSGQSDASRRHSFVAGALGRKGEGRLAIVDLGHEAAGAEDADEESGVIADVQSRSRCCWTSLVIQTTRSSWAVGRVVPKAINFVRVQSFPASCHFQTR